MSSSYRKPRVALAVAAVVAMAGAHIAGAADKYIIPEFSANTEYHNNLDLLPGSATSASDQSVAGYTANLAATMGLRSQRGRTEIRPEIVFQEYPDRDDLERTNQYLDAKSEYSWLRAHFDVVGRYSKEDDYKAQLPAAGFDSFDPQDQSVSGTGRIVSVSQNVKRVYVRPTWSYQLTERMSGGLQGSYETVNYNLDGLDDRVDYHASNAQAFLLWDVGLRSHLQSGIYGSKYEAAANRDTTDAYGLSADFQHDWSPTFKGTLSMNVEKADIEQLGLPDESSTNFGLTLGVERKLQTGQLRFQLGRSYQPSSIGSRAQYDQLRFQYNRYVTSRWSYGTAIRAFRSRGESIYNGNDRDYARASADVSRMLTQRWFVTGGYDFIWQKYTSDSLNRTDHVLRLQIGYRGLDPQ